MGFPGICPVFAGYIKCVNHDTVHIEKVSCCLSDCLDLERVWISDIPLSFVMSAKTNDREIDE